MDFSNLEFKFVSKPNILLLVVSGILFISPFLPWRAWPGGFAFGGYLHGFVSGGVLTFLMSLVGISASFIEMQKTRGIIALGAGILSLLGTIIFFATLGGWSVSFGGFIALVASIGLGYVGYMEYRKSMGLSVWGPSGGQTPPAQMPPSQTPPSQTPPPAGPTAPPPPPPPPPPAPPK